MKKNFMLFLIISVSIILISIILLVLNSFFLNSDLGNDSDGELIIYYDNEVYERIYNWYPTGNINKKSKAWVGYTSEFSELKDPQTNDKIHLYDNDPNNLFVIKNYKSWFYDEKVFHKKSDNLPKVYSEDAIIVLSVFTDENNYNKRKEITLQLKISSELKQFIKQIIVDPTYIDLESRETELAIINIYFNNYPAYNVLCGMDLSKSGNIILYLGNTNNYTGYYVVPKILSEQLKTLINENK